MPLSKIKSQYLSKRVAFGKTAAPLYKREDIDDLAIIALESGHKNLIELFEVLPELSVLKKARTEAQLKRNAPVAKEENKDPNAELKQQRPDIEQNKQDPNAENKELKDVGPDGTDLNK